jgi:DNA polymerase delta subunit 3
MALPHRQWLAAHIFSEQQTVSYRTLVRVLKTHVNAAKRMLYDFHVHENAKKPGSVHATYLLAGIKEAKGKQGLVNGGQNGTQHEDEPIPSSPPPFTSSMLQSSQQNGDNDDEEVPTIRTVTLVREESLDGIFALRLPLDMC